LSIDLLFLLILMILNAFFAASEIALISMNDTKIKLLAEQGDKKAGLLVNLLAEPSRFLATIQVGITLAGFLASAFAAGSFAGRMADLLHDWGVPLSQRILETVSVVIITIILSYFTLVIGELVPKRIAMQRPEPISMFVARPLSILSALTYPFVKLLTLSTNGILRLFGIDPDAHDEEVTEEEIRMMVDVGKERGTIQDTEKTMINNIFEFDNTTVSMIMVHRTNVTALSADADFEEVVHFVNQEKFTRFPVYEEDIDHITGVLHVKDILQYMETGVKEDFDLKRVSRSPYFVPESRMTDELFQDLQLNKVHLAVVLDEFGGTAGIVTLEDLLEEIVGDIYDEYDDEEEGYEQIDERVYEFEGTTNLHDAERILETDLPSGEFDTVSGFIISELGEIPEPGAAVEFERITFKVLGVDEKRINRVLITLPEDE